MTHRLVTAIEHRRRIRRAVEHLESQSRLRPDAWLTLGELADAAALSPFHFIRLYQHATGETPQATARRLKLQAARRLLAAQPGLAVIDVALEHGYESAQAFARAYRRQFGSAPSDRARACADPAAQADAWVVRLPPLAMQAMAIAPGTPDAGMVFDELMGHLDVAGVARHQQDMFCVVSPDLRLAQACAMQNPGVGRSLRLDARQYGGGWHLCISGQPQAAWRRCRDPLVAAARDAQAPLLLRYLNDPAYRTQQEQRVELYVPLVSGAALDELRHAPS